MCNGSSTSTRSTCFRQKRSQTKPVVSTKSLSQARETNLALAARLDALTTALAVEPRPLWREWNPVTVRCVQSRPAGKPAAGCRVSLLRSDGNDAVQAWPSVANNNGVVILGPIGPGSYRLRVATRVDGEFARSRGLARRVHGRSRRQYLDDQIARFVCEQLRLKLGEAQTAKKRHPQHLGKPIADEAPVDLPEHEAERTAS